MNITGLDLNLIAVLDALFSRRSVSGAALLLDVSQPTVSFSLKKLRGHFDDPLFLRSGNTMRPTARAEALQAAVRQVMDLISNEILQPAEFDPLTSQRRFTLSTSDIGELTFLPGLIVALRERAPAVTLRVVSMPPADLQRAMADGVVDLALGYFPDFAGTSFFEQSLFDHPFVCLVRQGHPCIRDELTLSQFLAGEHLVVAQEGRSQELFEQRLAQLALLWQVEGTGWNRC